METVKLAAGSRPLAERGSEAETPDELCADAAGIICLVLVLMRVPLYDLEHLEPACVNAIHDKEKWNISVRRHSRRMYTLSTMQI